MRVIELDEGLERQHLGEIQTLAAHLQNRMEDLLRRADQEPDLINGNGEANDTALRFDLACARYALLRRLARGSDKEPPRP